MPYCINAGERATDLAVMSSGNTVSKKVRRDKVLREFPSVPSSRVNAIPKLQPGSQDNYVSENVTAAGFVSLVGVAGLVGPALREVAAPNT